MKGKKAVGRAKGKAETVAIVKVVEEKIEVVTNESKSTNVLKKTV